ncbi:MAG TPA: DNA gyrase modulator, partial [Armatimonadota bacterium]
MDYEQLAQDIVHDALRAGADEAEVYLQTGEDFDVDVRKGEIETLTQAGSKGLGLRVFVDKRMAFTATTDFERRVLDDLVNTVVKLAKAASRDRFNGLPDVGPGPLPRIDLYDQAVVDMPAERKIEVAMETDRASFDYDPRITNSSGAGFGTHFGTRILANSNGILYSNSYTDCGL